MVSLIICGRNEQNPHTSMSPQCRICTRGGPTSNHCGRLGRHDTVWPSISYSFAGRMPSEWKRMVQLNKHLKRWEESPSTQVTLQWHSHTADSQWSASMCVRNPGRRNTYALADSAGASEVTWCNQAYEDYPLLRHMSESWVTSDQNHKFSCWVHQLVTTSSIWSGSHVRLLT